MAMNHLINTAMMPNANGLYASQSVSKKEFATYVKLAHAEDELQSYIGYPETAALLSDLCGVPIPTNRAETKIQNGDRLLVAKLIYRVQNPKDKGRIKPTIDDFEFRVVDYFRGDK